MFALREIITGKLYALAEAPPSDVFNQCFEQWQDVTFLHEFFLNNPAVLAYYGKGRKEGIKKIIKEAGRFEDDLLSIVNSGEGHTSLDTIFTALHTDDNFETPFLQSKAYGNEQSPCFLRLYAIRLNDGCYVVVAGLIKTTRALQESEEGKAVLSKLKEVAEFLRENNFEDAYNLTELIL